MPIEIIKVVPLERNYTQVPNALINSALHNNTFRAVVWLMSLQAGSTSARQIASAANVAYNGRPHRAIMRDLRSLNILTSRKLVDNGKVIGEFLEIDLNVKLEIPVRSKRPTRSAKRPNSQCVSSYLLKTKLAGAATPTKRLVAAPACIVDDAEQRHDAKKGEIAASLGLTNFSKSEIDDTEF